MARINEKIGDLREEIPQLEEENHELREQIRYLSDRKNNDLDSIEFGAPSKGGRVKVYINTKGPAEWNSIQVDEAVGTLDYLKKKMEVERE